MRWADERYVRLYVRDTTDWRLLQWQSKALLPLLMRKLDRDGRVAFGKHGIDGLALLVELPAEVAGPGLEGLLKDGCIRRDGDDLWMPNFRAGQETRSSDKVRKAGQREREAVTDVTRENTGDTRHSSLAVPSSTKPSGRSKASTFARSAEKPPTRADNATGPELPSTGEVDPPPSEFVAYLLAEWQEAEDVPKKAPGTLAEIEKGWRAAYPAVDLLAEAKKARAWQLGDTARRRKPRALRFLAGWFGRTQQGAATQSGTPGRPKERSGRLPDYRPEPEPAPSDKPRPGWNELMGSVAKAVTGR